MILSACGSASMVIDYAIGKADSEVHEIELNETQVNQWNNMKVRIKKDIYTFVHRYEKHLSHVHLELQKNNPDVNKLAQFLKKKVREKPSLSDIQLGYYKELHDMLDSQQRSKLYTLTQERFEKVLKNFSKDKKSFFKRSRDQLEDLVEDLDLNTSQKSYWNKMKKRTEKKDLQHVERIIQYLKVLHKEFKKDRPDVDGMIRYLKQQLKRNDQITDEHIDYYLEVHRILNTQQRMKGYALVRKKLDKLIQFLRN